MNDVAKLVADIMPYTRDQVVQLGEVMEEMPQLDVAVTHHFAPGVYVRAMYMPADSVVVGKIHRHELMNVLVSGTVRLTTDRGIETLSGFHIFNSVSGSKKALYAITDVVFIGIHPTDLTDLDEIEREFIAPDFESLEVDDFIELEDLRRCGQQQQ